MLTFPKPVKKKKKPRYGVYRKYPVPIKRAEWLGDPLLEPYYPGIAKISPELYAEVKRRSKGICEICGKHKAEEMHHLAGRRRKAVIWNMLDCCDNCHDRPGSEVAIHNNEEVYCREMLKLQKRYFELGYTRDQVRFLLGTKDRRLF